MTDQYLFERLDKESYSIIVLWLSGFPTDVIASVVEVTSGKVRGVTRSREKGGKMPQPRDGLSKDERQAMLNELKKNRLDEDFLKPMCFTAHELRPNQATRQGRKEASSFRQACEIIRADVEEKRRVRSEGGAERRGDRAHAVLYLERSKLLDDPKSGKSGERVSASMRRAESARWMRKTLEDAQISGFKEVSLEISSGGMGMPIHERIVAALSDIRAVQSMMDQALYATVLVPVVFEDAFIWEVPGKATRSVILEGIRRSIDIVSLYQGTLSREAYRIRWETEPPMVAKSRSRDESRDAVRTAREIIREGVRQS